MIYVAGLRSLDRGFADLEGKMDRGFTAVAEDIVAIKDDIAEVKSTLTTRALSPSSRMT
jgi:hypothetical protein